MNFRWHIGLGGLLTIITMLIINIIVAIKNNAFADEIFTIYYDMTLFSFWIIALPIIFLYNILPDIDHPKSMTTLLAYSSGTILVLIGLMSNKITEINNYISGNGVITYGIIIILATLFFSSYTKHRGPTHTIQFVIISTILLYLVGIQHLVYYSIALISVWMHLWLDKIPLKISFKPSNGWW